MERANSENSDSGAPLASHADAEHPPEPRLASPNVKLETSESTNSATVFATPSHAEHSDSSHSSPNVKTEFPDRILLTTNTRAINVDHQALNSFHHHLTPTQLAALEDNPYDINWMQNAGISLAVLGTFSSKDKLEDLACHHVLEVNDQIYRVSADGTEKCAIITQLEGTVIGPGKGKHFLHADIYRNGDLTEVVSCFKHLSSLSLC